MIYYTGNTEIDAVQMENEKLREVLRAQAEKERHIADIAYNLGMGRTHGGSYMDTFEAEERLRLAGIKKPEITMSASAG